MDRARSQRVEPRRAGLIETNRVVTRSKTSNSTVSCSRSNLNVDTSVCILNQPDTPHHVLEPRVVAHGVESGVGFEPSHQLRVLLVGLFEVCESRLLFPQAGVDQ